VEIEAPLTWPKGADRTQQVREVLSQYAARLEARVRASPERYRNWHTLRLHLPSHGRR
jgi:predicted LPLAT superfamily acyltransferase